MTTLRFAILVAIAIAPVTALTLLLVHADQRVRAINPADLTAAGYNVRNASYSLAHKRPITRARRASSYPG